MGGAWHDKLKEVVPSMSNQDLSQFALKALQQQLGVSANPTKVHVQQLSKCIPQYYIGHSKHLENLFSRIETLKLPLSLVGSSYKGPAVNDCINTARLEVEKVTGKQLQ